MSANHTFSVLSSMAYHQMNAESYDFSRDRLIFYDGISHVIRAKREVIKDDQLTAIEYDMNDLFNSDNPLFVHILSSNSSVSSITNEKIYVSFYFPDVYNDNNDPAPKYCVFVIHAGLPYSNNFFAPETAFTALIRRFLESRSKVKLFVTEEAAKQAVIIFQKYFKIKIRCLYALSKDKNAWRCGLESVNNKKFIDNLIRDLSNNPTFESCKRDIRYDTLRNFVTKLDGPELTETDNFKYIFCILF